MKSILFPSFLIQFDNWLKLNKPNLWVLNLHYIIYYCLISTAIQSAIAFAYPVDLRNMVTVEMVFGYLMIPVTVATIFWILSLIKYNVHETFVHQSIWKELGKFFGYILVLFIIITQAYVMPAVFNYKNGKTLSDTDLKIVSRALNYLNQNNFHEVSYDVAKDEYKIIFEDYPYYDEALKKECDTIQLHRINNSGLKNAYLSTLYVIKYTKKDLLKEINDFITIHNQWFPELPIRLKAEDLIQKIVNKEPSIYTSLVNQSPTEYGYYSYSEAQYLNNLYYDVVKSKRWSNDLFDEACLFFFWASLAIAYVIWLCSLLRWQDLVRLVIVLAASPILIGILGVTLFGLMDMDDDYVLVLIPIPFFLFLFQSIKSMFEHNFSGYKNVITCLIVIAFPISSFYFYGAIDELTDIVFDNNGLILGMDRYEFSSYCMSIAITAVPFLGILGIMAFSPILKRHYALPKAK